LPDVSAMFTAAIIRVMGGVMMEAVISSETSVSFY
jgi:hypothetical protein